MEYIVYYVLASCGMAGVILCTLDGKGVYRPPIVVITAIVLVSLLWPVTSVIMALSGIKQRLKERSG
jgi:hypothetical protein